MWNFRYDASSTPVGPVATAVLNSSGCLQLILLLLLLLWCKEEQERVAILATMLILCCLLMQLSDPSTVSA